MSQFSRSRRGLHPRWFLLTGPNGPAEELPVASLFGLARSQSWPGSAPDLRRQKRPCLGPEDTVVCLCVKAQPCPQGQDHTSILNVESPYRHICLRDLESFWSSSSLDGSAERRMGLIGVEGAHWGGLKCCLQNWGMLSQALALAPVSVAVETLASSCSPEKNAARSQQLFLPDSSPRKSRASGSALPAKRKVPGESLINPGFKSKKAPSGVNFEDS
ncbi:PREDICTED: protein PAXX [Sturnus vulgaris]|uniref:protein PAXX n=1 Tax=Sturnus vulgaris TaxID=9172 RepID=UPI00071A6210|nr:PREDICTED: protein PAXX [Sturnus vulgaris]